MALVRRPIGTAILLALVFGPAAAVAAPAGLSAHDTALINRITWGANASSAAEFKRLGARKWLDAQLHPTADDGLPDPIRAEIEALPVVRTPVAELVVNTSAESHAAKLMVDTEMKDKAKHAVKDELVRYAQQAAARSMLRDIYSRNQLKEQMSWFWLNHFNVDIRKANVRGMIGDYEERAIRPYALGRFRDLLGATVQHPAMLRYLDNAENTRGHANENYARELMELHTLGVGSGYTQKDVQELARILTGVGIDIGHDDPRLPPNQQGLLVRAGLFEFNPQRHDFGDKVFLGHVIKGRGYAEVEEALDILARDPATARHVSRQMAVYFVGDSPSDALVDSMARTFRRSDGNIPEVLKTLFASREFDQSLGKSFKDPMHYAISAVRLAYDGRVVGETHPIETWLAEMGQPLYLHETPDGYPMTSAAWNAPGQIASRFAVARQLGGPSVLVPADEIGPGGVRPLPGFQQAAYEGGVGQQLGVSTQAVLAKSATPQEWNALFLSSPEFMRR